MNQKNAWETYDEADLKKLEQLSAEYIDFISRNKTERRFAKSAIEQAKAAGYESLGEAYRQGRALHAGDKVYAAAQGKAVILAQIGANPMEEGVNILGAHIDSPRLDVKQNPLF